MPSVDVDKLYRRYGHMVFRPLSVDSLIGRKMRWDALQEVFAKVIKYAHRFDDNRSPVPWLMQIANRVCFDRYAKRKTRCSTIWRADCIGQSAESRTSGHRRRPVK